MLPKILIFVAIFSPLKALASFEIGVGTHANNYNDLYSNYVITIKDYGFNSVRDGFSWNTVQKSLGHINSSNKSKEADLLFSENDNTKILSKLFVLGYGSNIYTQGDYPQNKEEVDRFVDYVGWVANRYKGKIKYYEVWNEWLLGTGIGSTANRPNDEIFLYLLQQSYQIIKKIDPNAIVLAGSINPLHSNEVYWLNGLIKKGAMNYVDGISIHPYAYNEPRALRDPEGSFAALDSFEKQLTKSAGKSVPIYITEMGYPTGFGFSGGVSSLIAGQNVVKYTILAASRSYIKGLWWYDLIDDGVDKKDKEDNFGLFYTDGKNKESAQLLKVLIPIIKSNKITVTSNNVGDYDAVAEGKGTISWQRHRNYSLQQWLEKLNSWAN